jgi:hypothetical protein
MTWGVSSDRDQVMGRGFASRCLSVDAPLRLPPRVIQRPRHSIGAVGLQIAHYKSVYLSWKSFQRCGYFARRHSSIGVIIPRGVFTGDPFVTMVSPVIVTYRMRVAPLSAGADAFSI